MIDTTTFKATLEAELSRITTDLSSIATLEPESGDWVVHPEVAQAETDENSEADAYEETEERQAILGELETAYRNIKRALEKINNDTFGVCEICGLDIEPERLEFLPTARTCKAHRDDERTLSL
jgi:RNA polymerase-binding transcription factor DksA